MSTSAAVRVARTVKSPKPVDQLTLSTGVVLRIQKVPPSLLLDIVADMEKNRPKPPKVFIAEKGREEENPNDPDYLSRSSSWEARLAAEINDAFILMGSTIESLPDGFEGPDDQSWIGRMRSLHRGDPEDTYSRYLYWVKYRAAVSEADIQDMIGAIGRLSGVSENDVQSAVNGFQR